MCRDSISLCKQSWLLPPLGPRSKLPRRPSQELWSILVMVWPTLFLWYVQYWTHNQKKKKKNNSGFYAILISCPLSFLGWGLCHWQQHQTHPFGWSRHHLFCAAIAPWAWWKDSPRRILGDRQTNQGNLQLRVPRYCEGIQEVRYRAFKMVQDFRGCRVCNQSTICCWCGLWTLPGSRSVLQSRNLQQRLLDSFAEGGGWYCAKLPHRYSPWSLQEHRAQWWLNHVQGLWQTLAKRHKESCGLPYQA